MKFTNSSFRLLLSAAVAAAMLAGCGASGPTEKQKIATVVKREGADPSTLCSHLTGSLLTRLGGQSGCLHAASVTPADPTTHAISIDVHGPTATAVVIDRAGTRTVSLVRQRGVWKISGVA
ncbi:MAG TPA: hypothetical protein VGI50_05225 [Solirubrobacteraceae bacterium]|jgi:hypothetical protein